MKKTVVQQSLLEAAVAAMPEGELSAIRTAAAARFADSGFPTIKHEDWRYTNLAGAAEISNGWLKEIVASPTLQTAHSSLPGSATKLIEQIDAYWLTFINGMVTEMSAELLHVLEDGGVDIRRLSEVIDQNKLIGDDPMSTFNAALLQDGLLIRATAGARLEKPIGLLFVDDDSSQLTQARTIIDLSVNAHLDVIECALSEGSDPQFANTVTQTSLATGSTLNFVRLQQRNDQHMSVNRFEAKLDSKATVNHNSFDFGGSLARNDVVAEINGKDANVGMLGLFLAGQQQHIDNHTRVDHRVGPAVSNEEYRGILNGRSRCVFNGKAVVHKGADGTDANQSNHNLLLSDYAEIDTKPELEIYADDVKCSHGATVGQLDKSALFYLRSRGLGLEEATQLLTRAFASGILSELAIEECREYLTAVLNEALDELISEE